MIDAGLARSTINQHVGRIRRMFRWLEVTGLGSEPLIPASFRESLRLVDGLRAGRTIAREPDPIRPVDDATVDATLPAPARRGGRHGAIAAASPACDQRKSV